MVRPCSPTTRKTGTTARHSWSGRPSSRELLAAHRLELVVLHWFDRMEHTTEHDRKHPQVQVATESRLGPNLTIRVGEQRRTEHDLT